MTNDQDLKAAEEWANARHGTNPHFPIEVQRDPEDWLNMRDAYLAGLAAGRKEREWVSVKERLPEDGITVMVWHDTLEHEFAYVDSDELFRAWYDVLGNEIEAFPNITHWMPLPDVPKEEK